jgi:DNA-binding NarL/FixJ family response regulator
VLDRPPITVLVVDDHQMVAESIVRSLREEPDIDVVGVAGTAERGIALGAELRPEVVLMDYGLPDLDGASAAARLRELSPGSHVVLVTGHGGSEVVVAALKAGCAGFLEKRQGLGALATAIRLVAAGEMILPTDQLAALLPAIRRGEPGQAPAVELTPRETEILGLMSEGLVSKTIARKLGVSLNTVRNHVQNILGKLDAHTRLEAVAIATRMGLVRRPDGAGG